MTAQQLKYSAANTKKLEFAYYREVNLRKLEAEQDSGPNLMEQKQIMSERIKEFLFFITSEELMYGVARRESNFADIYYDYLLCSSSTSTYSDIRITQKNIYLLQINEEKQKTTILNLGSRLSEVSIPFKYKSRVGFDVCKEKVYRSESWKIYRFQHLAPFLQLFSTMNIIGTNLFVGHGNMVSVQQLDKYKKWINHLHFDAPIKSILKVHKTQDSFNLAVVLTNGFIQVIGEDQNTNPIQWKVLGSQYKCNGQIESVISDWNSMATHFIMTKTIDNESKIESNRLYGLHRSNFKEISKKDVQITKDDQLVKFISDDQEEEFIIYNKVTKTIKIFKVTDRNLLAIAKVGEDIQLQKVSDQPIMVAMRSYVENQIIYFDSSDGFIVDTKTGEAQEVNDLFLSNIILLDQRFFYSVLNTSQKTDSGLYFQSFDSFIQQKQEDEESAGADKFRIKHSIGGKSNILQYFKQEERIAYQSDFQTIKIVPLLHRNVISFFGMKERSAYLGFKKIDDKLIALEPNGTLTYWNSQTGKLEGTSQAKQNLNLHQYKIYCDDEEKDTTYKMDWYQNHLLLVNKTEEVKVESEKEFFGKRYQESINGGTAFIEKEMKKYYRFKIIEILNHNEVVVHLSFIHPIYEAKPGKIKYQRLYFSDVQKPAEGSERFGLMLEMLADQKVFLYKCERIQPEIVLNNNQITLQSTDVKWNLIKRLEDFSYDISEFSYNNYLFSPDLKHYLDFDMSENVFLIRNVMENEKSVQIPQGFINPKSEKPELIAQKFKWISSTRFKIINNYGFEKLIDIENGFKQLGYCKLPLLDLEQFKPNGNSHYYLDQKINGINMTYQRLVRKYQDYFSTFWVNKIRNQEELRQTLQSVDFGVNNCQDKLVIDLSFTYLHWKVTEEIQDNDEDSLIIFRKLNAQQLKLLLVNIFPNGDTFLHAICGNSYILKEVYRIIEEDNKNLKEGQMKFTIPFLQNFKEKSPMHLCHDSENLYAIDTILQNVKNDEIDNHARAIVDLIPSLILLKLPSLNDYLESRIIKTDMLNQFKRGTLKHRSGIDYAVGSALQWPDNTQVKADLFRESKIEQEVQMQIFDLPYVHEYKHKIGNQLFSALTKVNDIQIFNNTFIQALIDFKWSLAKEYSLKVLFFPFLLQLALFITYSNVFNGQIESAYGYFSAKVVVISLLYGTSVYFLINEIRQVVNNKLDYFLSIWNYSDILPPILIIIIISCQLYAQVNETKTASFIVTLHSFASLLLWVKFLYFLRIFKQTGYLINMLSTVVWDMKIFLLILLIVYLGFGEAFLRLSELSEDANFIKNYALSVVYAFRLSIGDTDTDSFDDTLQPTTLWIMFVLCALYTNVMMLNLLIAIISQSFDKIQANSTQAHYQERARIISENSYLIRRYRSELFTQDDSYLITAREYDAESEINKKEEFSQIKEQISFLKDNQKSMEEKIDKILQAISIQPQIKQQ